MGIGLKNLLLNFKCTIWVPVILNGLMDMDYGKSAMIFIRLMVLEQLRMSRNIILICLTDQEFQVQSIFRKGISFLFFFLKKKTVCGTRSWCLHFSPPKKSAIHLFWCCHSHFPPKKSNSTTIQLTKTEKWPIFSALRCNKCRLIVASAPVGNF